METTQSVNYKTDKIMPTWEQLAEMGRDLRFHPSVTEQPKVLTPGAGDQFQPCRLYQRHSNLQ